MARPRKPTELLELSGAFAKDPQRKRSVGPKSSRPVGDPPKALTQAEQAMWGEIVSDAAGGVLTSADRGILELLSRLRTKFRADWLNGAEMAQYTRCCSLLGMTPSDRSKVSIAAEPQDKSPWDQFGGPKVIQGGKK